MIKVAPNLLIVRPEQLKKTHEVKRDDGSVVAIDLNFAGNEKRLEAATTEGDVVDIGDTCFTQDDFPAWFSVGDRILWGKYAGYWVTDPETKEELVVLDPKDVLCVIAKGDAK